MTRHRFGTVNRNTPAAKARRQKYNSRDHKEAGIRFTADVAAGRAHCWRCGRHIPAGTPRALRGRPGWVVGHDDVNVNVIRGPECYGCNSKAAMRKGGSVALSQRPSPRRPRPRVIPPPVW